MKRLAILLAILLAAAACGDGDRRAARATYNDGLAALAKGDFDAAEKALLDARSGAGVDPELRFRAAYGLGLAYAGHAESIRAAKDADLPRALDLAQRAASWLGDAARLVKDDADTQANLAIVRARMQAISDEMRKGERKLEARLDALIAEQRELLDDARGAWIAIRQTGGADPLAQQGTLTHLADRERGVVAEAGVIGDLADDESAAIGAKPKDQRSEEDAARVVQLANLGVRLGDARTRIGEARRKLQESAAQDGVARAEAALTALKRAREQLLDPITILKNVAQDQIAVLDETVRAGGDASVVSEKAAAEPLPAWLEPPVIAGRQGGLRERVEEVRARLTAFVEHEAEPSAEKPEDPKRAKLKERVAAALPSVVLASDAMARARDELAAKKTKPAAEDQEKAIEALARAVEEFADLKNLVDIASAQQKEVVALLAPEAAKEMEPAARAKRTKDAIARNRSRMTRLAELIAEETAELDAKSKEPPAPQPGAAGGGSEEAKKAALQQKERLKLAETLRARAEESLASLDRALAADNDPQPPAKDADGRLDEMRKLFFTIVEHLEQLIRDQGETRDQTSAANADDAAARAPKLPSLVTREEDHDRMAKAITEALAKQADAAAGKPPQPGAPDAKALTGAVEEMRLAGTSIGEARDAIAKSRDAKAGEDLAPALKDQATAIEHLVAALRLLEPRKDENQDKDQQEQQQQQQQAEPKPKDEQQSPGGAAQRARDEDARRQRERRSKEGRTPPVEKDW